MFGLFLGGVVVSLAYLGLAWAVDLPNEQPEWYRSARTRPVVEWSAHRLLQLAPAEWRGPVERGAANSSNGSQQRDSERAMQKLLAPRPETAAQQQKSGYGDRERREMDRLIKSHQ